MSRRIAALDGMRGIAILAVLLHHAAVFAPADLGGVRFLDVSEFFGHGVDLFFVLSGFLIAKQLDADGAARIDGARFWVRRVAKIVPLYILLVAATYLFLGAVLQWTGQITKLQWFEATSANWIWYLGFASNIRNALDGRFTNPALDVSWSLAVEVQFYVLAFVVARCVPRKHWGYVVALTVAGALLFRTAAAAAGANWIQILVLTPGRLDAFACGAAVAVCPQLVRRWPGSVVLLVLACPLVFGWSRASLWCETIGYTAVAVAAAIAMERVIRPEIPGPVAHVLCGRWLAFLGRISYSVYLTHLPIRSVLRDAFLEKNPVLDTATDWLRQAAFALATAATCVVIGWLTWKFVEEPARRAITRFCCGADRPGTAQPAGFHAN